MNGSDKSKSIRKGEMLDYERKYRLKGYQQILNDQGTIRKLVLQRNVEYKIENNVKIENKLEENFIKTFTILFKELFPSHM